MTDSATSWTARLRASAQTGHGITMAKARIQAFLFKM